MFYNLLLYNSSSISNYGIIFQEMFVFFRILFVSSGDNVSLSSVALEINGF